MSETDKITQEPTENLLAGKFKTVEDLEKSYTQLQTLMGQRANVQTEFEALKAQNSVPESYNVESLDVEHEVLTDWQAKAKRLGLTQSQFDNFCQSNIDSKVKIDEQRKDAELNKAKKYGEGVYEQTKKYIASEHKLSESTIKNLSEDELTHFSRLHKKFTESPQITGSTSAVYQVTRTQVNEAREAYNEAPHSQKDEAWAKYESLAKAICEKK